VRAATFVVLKALALHGLGEELRWARRSAIYAFVCRVTSSASPFAQLLEASRDLEARARLVQGDEDLLVDEAELASLADGYHAWLARALEILPSQFHEKFRFEYEGNFFQHRIKQFLESPGERNPLFNPDENPLGLCPWNHPFESEFRAPTLRQRQILAEARQLVEGDGGSRMHMDLVEQITRRLPDLLEPLSHRHDGRQAFAIEDEYDLQDLLHGLLRVFFDDVRPEDYVPEHAGGKSRVDFVLKSEKLVVETKMTRPQRGAGEVGKELIVDIERYRAHPDCSALVAVVYDPDRRIKNRRTLEADLSRTREGVAVRVVVVQ